ATAADHRDERRPALAGVGSPTPASRQRLLALRRLPQHHPGPGFGKLGLVGGGHRRDIAVSTRRRLVAIGTRRRLVAIGTRRRVVAIGTRRRLVAIGTRRRVVALGAWRRESGCHVGPGFGELGAVVCGGARRRGI